MRIDGFSYDTLRGLDPQSIRLYLASCGRVLSKRAPKFDVYRWKGDGTAVTVPVSKDFADYPDRVEEVVGTVSDVQDISVQSTVAGMSVASLFESIGYRYVPEDGEVGLIPVGDLSSIVRAGSDINLYAYRDLVDFRQRYTTARWDRRKDLDAIRIGPALPGSYVVQFMYPVRNDGADLGALCGRVEVSRTGPGTIGREPRRTVSLTSGLMRRISALEKGMRPEERSGMVPIKGMLVQVSDSRAAPDDGPVRMRIRFFDSDERIRTASFVVRSEDVSAAYDAAKGRRLVSLSGTLSGPARGRRIDDYTDFRVLE